MAIKIRLPNGRYIKVETDDPRNAQAKAQEYYNNGGRGFVDKKTRNLAAEYDKRFDYDSGVQAPWLRTKLAAMETLGGKEKVLEDAVGSDGFTRDSSGSLALTPLGMERLGFDATGKNVIIDESGLSMNDLVDFAGALGPIAGSILGSVVTRGRIKPSYPGIKNMTLKDLGKISLGTGTGAAGGKYVEEGIEYVAGLQDQGVADLAKLGATEFAIGAGGEFLFGAAAKGLKASLGQNALARGAVGTRAVKEAASLAKGVKDEATGKVYKGATAIAGLESPITGQLQPILEAITKYKGREDNLAKSLLATLKNLYRKTNDLTADYNVTIDDLRKEGFADVFSQVESGRLLREGLLDTLNKLESKADVASGQVTQSANQIIKDFDAFAEPATSQAGNDIREFAVNAYASWDETVDSLYEPLQNFFKVPTNVKKLFPEGTSGAEMADAIKLIPKESLLEPIEFINAAPLRAQASQLRKSVLKGVDEDDPLFKDLMYLENIGGADGNMSLDALLKIRKDLASKLRVTGNNGQPAKYAGLDSKERQKLLTTVNNMFKNIEDGSELAVGMARQAFENAAENVQSLRRAQGSRGGRPTKAENEYISDLLRRAEDAGKISTYIKGLKIANGYFSKGFQAFDDVNFRKILNDASAGGADVDQIVSSLVIGKKNNGEKLSKLLSTLDSATAGIRGTYDETGRLVRGAPKERVALTIPKEQKRILAELDIKVNEPVFANSQNTLDILQKEYFRNIVKNLDPDAPVNYANLAKQINDLGTTTDVLFPNGLKRQLVQELMDADNMVNTGSVKELEELLKTAKSGDDIADAVRQKIAANAEVDQLRTSEIVRRMDQLDTEEIVSTLFKKGNVDEIRLVKETLGPDSEKFKQFQVGAMNKIITDVVNPGEDVVTKLFNEGKFSTLVDEYESVLRETFGDDQFKLMQKAADSIKYAMTAEKKAGGGTLFTQAFVMRYIFNPIGALRVFTPFRIFATALGSPTIIRYLAGEISDKEMLKRAPSLLRDFGYTRPITKSMLTQTLAEGAEDATQEATRYSETDGVDPNIPLGSVQLPKQQTASLDLPEVEAPASQRQTVGGRAVPASLISDPITRDLANLLGQ
tara:strand:+ start:6704 stop:10015 length:3312 start_codon:yes stop_codon:yes gene_type:complete